MRGDRTKIALEEKIFRINNKSQTCPNLRAIEQIPFELELFKVCSSREKSYSRKQR